MSGHLLLPSLSNSRPPGSNQDSLEQLLVLAHRLASTTQFKKLLVLLADYCLEQGQADVCVIALPDASGQWQTYSFQAEDGFRTRANAALEEGAIIFPSPSPLKQQHPTSAIRRIQQIRHLQILCEEDNTEENACTGLIDGLNFTSEHWYYHPLIYRQECVGIFYIERQKKTSPFTAEEHNLINFLVGHGAIALSNIRLHESVVPQAAAIEACIDGVAILENGRYIYHNPVYAGLFGYDNQELIGQEWGNLYPAEEFKRIQEDVLPLLLESGQWRGKSIGVRRDNSQFHTEITLFQLEDKKLICICRNISEEKDADFFFKLTQYSVDNAADCIFWLKQDGNVFYANHAASILYGYSLDELISMSIFEINRSMSPESWREHWLRLQSQTHCSIESEHTSKTGRAFPVEITANHLEFEGEEYNFLCVRDISDRHQQKEKLYESQRLLQLVLDTIPQKVFWKDMDSIYLGCNQRFSDVAGLQSPEDIVGLDDYALPWKLEEATFFQACDRRIMGSNQAELGIVETQKTANGQETWIETNKVPLHDTHGNVIGILGTYHDITKQKEAEKTLQDINETLEQRVAERTRELQESQTFLRSIMDTIPQSLFWKDTQAKFLGCNQNFLTAVGMERLEDIVAKTDQDLNLPWRYEAAWFRECDRRVIEMDEADLGVVEPHLRSDGSEGWLEISRVPLHNTRGDVIGVLGVFQDVTQRKQSEEALQQLNSELQEAKEAADSASQAKSEFLANMSHELRTPLNGILGYAQILSRSAQLQEKEQHGVSVIQDCGNHLLNLINDILEIAKIEARKLELHPTVSHFPSLLEGVINMCRIRADQKGIQFDYQANKNIPEDIIIDEKRLYQVLINLLGNAIKFTERGQVSMSIDAKELSPLSANQVAIQFTISDTGIGISDADINRLFRSFEQVGEQQKKKEGTGLGLAISQQIVQMMGGEILVKSQVGQGSEFSFEIELPLAKARPDQAVNQPPKRISGYKGAQKKILIIDDDKRNRDVLRELLEPLKFETMEAINGENGLSIIENFIPDLVITDIVMPVMNGHEFLKRAREQIELKSTVFIASSASASKDERQSSLDSGSDYFISKPFIIDELFTLIQASLKLDWVYEDVHRFEQAIPIYQGPPSTEAAREVMTPSPALLEEMLDLVQRGRVPKFIQLIQKICEEEPQYQDFLSPLRSLAMRFELEDIEIIFRSHLSAK